MDLILGMDVWVFAAWILTILSAIVCIIYGIYHQFIKKTDKEKSPTLKQKTKNEKKKEKDG